MKCGKECMGCKASRTVIMNVKLTLFSVILLLSCVHCQTVVNYNISEDIQNRTVIGNIVNDADLINSYDTQTLRELRFRFLQDNIQLAIDEYSGEIRMNDQIDRDILCPNIVECLLQHDVAVVNPSGHFEVITIKLTILDINDNSPQFPVSEFEVIIPELATPGATYNLPLAVDPDSPKYSVQGYNLDTDVYNFELKVISLNGEPKTIQLVLRQSVDREFQNFYQVKLVAYDGGTPSKIGKLLINVTVSDANDHGPQFERNIYEITIPEDIPIRTSIISVKANDQDIGANGAVVYKLASTTNVEFIKIFGIDRISGKVFLKRPLDYELTQSYHLMVEARDLGPNSQPAYATVVIQVEDVNDNSPQIMVNTADGQLHVKVSELASPGRFIAHISVKDPDGGLGGQFQCIVDDSKFELKPLSGGRYEVQTAAMLDRETREMYKFNVICEDKASISLSSSQELIVVATDENDNSPKFSQQIYTVVLEENNRINELILRVNATDQDAGWNADITYSLHEEDKDLFKIDARTGIVRANAVFDFETSAEVQFQVVATDGGDPALSSSAIINVIILDANDEPPKFTRDVFVFNIMENEPVGIEVGQVVAEDADSAPFDRVEYSLIHVSADAESFTIDTHTGYIRTRILLDREDRSLYYLSVMATNVGATPPLSGSTIVEVKVRDQNDNSPVIDFPSDHNHTVEMSNQVPVGYQVGVIQGHDLDLGVNGELVFMITPDTNNGMFAVDIKTGILVTRTSLAHVDMQTINMEIKVSDKGFPVNSASATLQINVNSSIPFINSNPNSLLSGTNMSIVIGLCMASVVVMIILIVAIVCIRKRDCMQKRRMLQYQCRVEQSSDTSVDSEKAMNSIADLGGQNKRPNSGGGVGKTSKREVNFIVEGNNGSTRGSISSFQPVSQNYNGQHIGGSRQAPATIPGNNEKPQDHNGPGHRHHKTGNNLAINGHRPLKLDASQLNIQMTPSVRPEEHDSDSAYSGDVSNTDSGRGPSEEGETQGPTSVHYGSNGNVSSYAPADIRRAEPTTMDIRPTTYHMTSFLPQVHPSNKRTENTRKPNHNGGHLIVHDSRPQSIKQIVDNNHHQCDRNQQGGSQKPPPIPSRQKRMAAQSSPSQGTNSQCNNNNNKARKPNTNLIRNGYHNNKNGYHSNRSSRSSRTSWDTIPEDDGGSTTSGSYIVDTDDLYLDDAPQLASSVTV